MKNSVAIWAKHPPIESDLHINYWIIKRGIFYRDHFLDFGIKLLNWDGGIITFYIPIKNIGESLIDISDELRERELANALFNENCKITSSLPKRFEIGLPNEKLTVFTFDKNNDVETVQRYDGTLFSIKIPEENKNWYLRFRIKIPYFSAIINSFKLKTWRTIRSSFSKKHTPGGSFYQSVRSSVEAVDFRVNNKRNLNLSLLDDNQDKFLKLRKLHFFLIYDNDEEFMFSTAKPKKVRLLENDVWSKYLQGVSGNNRKYCATHWSCSPLAEEGWEIFLKIRFASSNILTIGCYIILISLMAFIINISSAAFYDKFKETRFFDNLFKIGNLEGHEKK